MVDSGNISIQFGSGNKVERPADSYDTIQDILNDSAVVSFLTLPSEVEARLNGTSASLSTQVHAGDRVDFVTKANTKG
jgi:hypothetical protein